MKFWSADFSDEPTREQWSWLKQGLVDGLTIKGITEDSHKLRFLRSYTVSGLCAILSGATTFPDATDVLDAQFKKSSRIIYARHQVLSCRQRDDECITALLQQLGIPVEHCECIDLTVPQRKDKILRDSLISGLKSNAIRVRLLELVDSEISL